MQRLSNKLSDILYLDQIAHTEAVRTLPVRRRVGYAMMSAALIFIALMSMVGLALLVAFLLYPVLVFELHNLGDKFLLAAAVICTFLVLLGFTSGAIAREVLPGDDLAVSVTRSLRRGVILGFIVGLIFGMIWMFTVRISGLYVQLNTFYETRVYFMDFVKFGLVIALSVGLPFGVLNAVRSAAGHLALAWMRRPESTQTET